MCVLYVYVFYVYVCFITRLFMYESVRRHLRTLVFRRFTKARYYESRTRGLLFEVSSLRFPRRVYLLFLCALSVCFICMLYLYALSVCYFCMLFLYAIFAAYVCHICMPYMCVMYVTFVIHLVCVPCSPPHTLHPTPYTVAMSYITAMLNMTGMSYLPYVTHTAHNR